jgi:hypothetical protein
MQGSDCRPAVERAHERCRLEGELLAAVYDELLGLTLAEPADVNSDMPMSHGRATGYSYTEVLA